MDTSPTSAPRAPLPNMGAPSRRLKPWWAVVGVAAALTVLISALVAGVISKAMWGYFFARPSPHARVLSARQVVSVTPLKQMEQPNGAWPLLPSGDNYDGPGWYEREKAAFPEEYDYYLLNRRALRALERRGVITGPIPPIAATQLPDLAAMLRPTLAAEQPGYDRLLDTPQPGISMVGTLYELVGARGERLLLLAVRGGEVSNDHYPYFELLYESTAQGELTLVGSRRFYFDVAGLEGMEFTPLFVAMSVLGLVIVVPIVTAALVGRRLSASARTRRGCCPQCDYDLQGDLSNGCPECGWGRTDLETEG